MSLLLNPRLLAGLALCVFLAFTHLSAYRSGRHAVQTAWEAAKVASERAAQEQAQRNRELQRKAETRYVVRQDAQERFHTVTVRELDHDAAPLADCPVPEPVRLRLNEARACALDPAAGCDPDGAVPKP